MDNGGMMRGCPAPGKIDTTIREHKELFGADAPAHIVRETVVLILHEDEKYCRN